MSNGKLKLKSNGLFSSKWDFYEYARHSLRWSNESALSLMEAIANDSILNKIPYTETINMYIQLVSAFTASHLHYIYTYNVVPASLIKTTSPELTRGLNEGIEEFTINNEKIDEYCSNLFKVCVNKYLLDGLVKDTVSSSEEDADVYNPDIDNFTKLFVDDSKKLSEKDNNIIIDDMQAYALSQAVTDIPLTVYKKLSQMSITYIPSENNVFG